MIRDEDDFDQFSAAQIVAAYMHCIFKKKYFLLKRAGEGVLLIELLDGWIGGMTF